MAEGSDASMETRAEALAAGGEAKYWQTQLELSDKDHADWIKDGRSVVERYKGCKSKGGNQKKRFNILFSNTEVLIAACLGRMAKPDVRRRFSDSDPKGRIVAEVIERALVYCNDSYNAEVHYEAGLKDYLLPGRGTVRIKYEAKTGKAEDGTEYVADQSLETCYIAWEDYRHEPSGQWGDVTWEAFRSNMTRDDLRENFGSNDDIDVNKIPLNWSPESDKDNKVPEAYKKAEVWEIWDYSTRTRVWMVKGFDKLCRKDPDPYGIEQFFPNAEPLLAITSNDTLIPEPEFTSYKDQANGLDEIENRIDLLTKALKRRGVYNANVEDLKKLANAGDNQFIPVTKWAELSAAGGLEKAFESEDVSKLAQILTWLHEQRDLRVQTIYEVIGISDIMRGQSDPRETKGAQEIKAQFGGNRLKKRQNRVQRWIRDTFRLKAEIIAEHFEPQKLAEMTGFTYDPNFTGMGPDGQPIDTPEKTITPEIMQILRTDKLRSYRIDVETDSTIYEDAEAEKQSRIELVTAMSQFVAGWVPVIQMSPHLIPLAFETLSFVVRGFKTGRGLEEVIEQTRIQLEQAAQQAAQQPPPPDPALEVEKAKAETAQVTSQAKIQETQLSGQVSQMQAQADMQQTHTDGQVKQQQAATDMEKTKLDMQFNREKHEAEMESIAMKARAEAQSIALKAKAAEQAAKHKAAAPKNGK